MESTPRERKAFTDFYHSAQDGTGTPPVDKASQRPAKTMADAISGKLRGDATPSATDQPDAPTGVDPAVWNRAQASAADPQSPEYELASALLVVAQQLADLKGAQA